MSYFRRFDIKDFKFGIEVEIELDYYDEEEDFPALPGWRVKEEHCGLELISPPLIGYSGLLEVRRQLNAINKTYNRLYFEDCGLHVHVDASNITVGDVKHLLVLGSYYDDVLFSIMGPAREDNEYCRHLDYSREEIMRCSSLLDFQNLQDGLRYASINLYAFVKHGTIEFRYAEGTCDWKRIYSLISLYLRMITFAKNRYVIPAPVNGTLLDKFNQFVGLLDIKGGVREELMSFISPPQHIRS